MSDFQHTNSTEEHPLVKQNQNHFCLGNPFTSWIVLGKANGAKQDFCSQQRLKYLFANTYMCATIKFDQGSIQQKKSGKIEQVFHFQ